MQTSLRQESASHRVAIRPPASSMLGSLAGDRAGAFAPVGAGDCWPRIVEAGLDDPRKLLSRFDNELEALGIPPDAFPRLRGGLGCYRDQ